MVSPGPEVAAGPGLAIRVDGWSGSRSGWWSPPAPLPRTPWGHPPTHRHLHTTTSCRRRPWSAARGGHSTTMPRSRPRGTASHPADAPHSGSAVARIPRIDHPLMDGTDGILVSGSLSGCL